MNKEDKLDQTYDGYKPDLDKYPVEKPKASGTLIFGGALCVTVLTLVAVFYAIT